jgi:hypothetical protein
LRHEPAGSPVRAVLFDAYGTLFDVYSIGVAAERRFPASASGSPSSGATSRSNTPGSAR